MISPRSAGARLAAHALLLPLFALLAHAAPPPGTLPLNIHELVATPNDGTFVAKPANATGAVFSAAAAKTFAPDSKGSWSFGGTGKVKGMHLNLLPTGKKGGQVVLWEGPGTGTAYWNPKTKKFSSLRSSSGGIGAGKTAFCTAHVITVRGDIVVIGGHTGYTNVMRQWSFDKDTVTTKPMNPGRWYAGAATLPDGKILIIGGAVKSGYAGYFKKDQTLNNPTYQIYDPKTMSLGSKQSGMKQQLLDAFPVQTYPYVAVLPDGSVAVSAGSILVNYKPAGSGKFSKAFTYNTRPGGVPWSYPQTGQGIMLPLSPPYTSAKLLVSGGSSSDFATSSTSASSVAHVIDLMGGKGATWKSVGPMPYKRVMGDAVTLCDGTIFYVGGMATGTAGYYNPTSTEKLTIGKDGTTYNCVKHCPNGDNYLYSPAIYDPVANAWSAKGSLATHTRARLYHGSSILLPDCRVLIGGGDVTMEYSLEVYEPPYLKAGPRPKLVKAPSSAKAGASLKLRYATNGSTPGIDRVLLLRTGTATHTMSFDARSIFLEITLQKGPDLTVALPKSTNVLVPGWYMLVLLNLDGLPSTTKFIQITP